MDGQKRANYRGMAKRKEHVKHFAGVRLAFSGRRSASTIPSQEPIINDEQFPESP